MEKKKAYGLKLLKKDFSVKLKILKIPSGTKLTYSMRSRNILKIAIKEEKVDVNVLTSNLCQFTRDRW